MRHSQTCDRSLIHSSSYSYKACLRCLNVDKTYEPIQEIGKGYGSNNPQLICQIFCIVVCEQSTYSTYK